MFNKFLEFAKEKYNNTKILDRYILKQVIEMFLMGVFVFTTIIFASDTFITLIKQIAKFGIPFKVAFILILLNLPSVIVMTIPMGVLLATVMTLNKLSLSSEITVMRACGIGLNRIAKPIFIFAVIMSLSSFFINESVVPVMMSQSKTLALWALGQKNIPDGKENFVFKELTDDGILKRLFYVGFCQKKTLYNVTVLDNSKEGTIQVLQAREGKTSPDGWKFEKGAAYTITDNGQVLNTTLFDKSTVKFGLDLSDEMNKNVAKEYNFTGLLKFLSKSDITPEDRQVYTIELFDKIALPLTTIVFVLVGVPLAITPPRVRYNRGFLFSILIIFAYYVIRALSISFGEAGSIAPFLAACLPNIILTVMGTWLYYKKVYTIS
ncbi:MAG: LptF/LptG family permease [Candidatus Gastranaerophilaceae bacterium]|jgi:lipopolysaccharide export system permease protein|nr:YjgP/YjgQ family permease [bacterium]MEE0495399.1 LptF/LptG family permease [Cyanobacteriota bacterium]CDE92848.1 putative permease YjgP/YjgQ family [Fusobacterium sp. CAG:815]DAA89999.1 MAG TPA: YjgP/YjgQ family permease [Candidatus Gastranaerophilales bacterium HUM_6]DAA93760.1 MAG TPA: YjgP/YjgQ family permease [Candidatus Gastranaerophilales bacterium HUM_7]DAB02378.1 MAG TPA: YjgP/YjgQ family permease [Candidatus Gastranaerophilales bacterium HUM_12]DAB07305.1 MAG TPA: YjgP/YjgQ famil